MRPLSKWDAILKDLDDEEEKEKESFAMDLATAREIAVSRADSTTIEEAQQSRNEAKETKTCDPAPKADGAQ